MRHDAIHSDASTRRALHGLFSGDGARLPARRAIHEAMADVEEGLEFWKTIAGNVPPKHRASREFLNRQG